MLRKCPTTSVMSLALLFYIFLFVCLFLRQKNISLTFPGRPWTQDLSASSSWVYGITGIYPSICRKYFCLCWWLSKNMRHIRNQLFSWFCGHLSPSFSLYLSSHKRFLRSPSTGGSQDRILSSGHTKKCGFQGVPKRKPDSLPQRNTFFPAHLGRAWQHTASKPEEDSMPPPS
jgi:dolichyl-phosphate-mannose--protein O-mannosyl transferase